MQRKTLQMTLQIKKTVVIKNGSHVISYSCREIEDLLDIPKLIDDIHCKEYEESPFDSIESDDATRNYSDYLESMEYWLHNREPETTFHMDMEEYIAHEVKRKNNK